MAANKKSVKKSGAAKKAPQNKRRSKRQSPARGSNPLAREITFLVIIVFSILSLMSAFHMCGIFGEYLSNLMFGLLGALAYIFPVYLIVASGFLVSNPENSRVKWKVGFSAGLFWSICGFFQWVVNHPVENIWEIYSVCGEKQNGGGFLGGLLSFELARALGRGGALIVILALALLFFMLISGKLIFSSIRQMYQDREERAWEEDTGHARDYADGYANGYVDGYEKRPVPRRMNTYKFDEETTQEPEIQAENQEEKRKRRKKPEKTEELETEQKPEPVIKQDPSEIHIIRGTEPELIDTVESEIYKEELAQKFGPDAEPESVIEEKKPEKIEKTEPVKTDTVKAETAKNGDESASRRSEPKKEAPYRFPSLELLNRPKAGAKTMNNTELRETAKKLQDTLQSFGVGVKMGDISLGPSVTRYELIPEQGVKVSRITSLADDIKLSLAASDIRIEAPIPGKAAVGIEVPNPERTMITLRELLESREFTGAKSKVTFAVGKDISGRTIVTDIAKMPHLLIAGATGSGKSVLINTLIMSIIYKADPADVKMIMVDPKMVELTAYEDIPHLMIPVVKDPKKASAALAWAVAEMTDRYQKFADAGVRDIATYNSKIKKEAGKGDSEYQKMPQIVIIVDEFADLMMVAPGEVEDAVCRLAQLARAAGIHLVLATQRPSVNVITGLIKANIPSRIALSVSSAVDSRTIIDSGGAEKLLGNGDMLFAPQNLPKPIRVQGAFVSDEERDGVVNFLKTNSSGPAYNEEVTAHIDAAPAPGAGGGAPVAGGANASGMDELFSEAGFFIIEKEKASIGLLQRMFRIGFNRAARIMDQLADAGVVGPEEGTKARQILMTKEQFENYLEENA